MTNDKPPADIIEGTHLEAAIEGGRLKKGDRVAMFSTITGTFVSATSTWIAIKDDGGRWIHYPKDCVTRVTNYTVPESPKFWPPKPGDIWVSNPIANQHDASQEVVWFVVRDKGSLEFMDSTGYRKTVISSLKYHLRGDLHIQWRCLWRKGELERQ